MSVQSERNLFRRLIGDYGKNAVSDTEIETYLDDTCYELTADFATPVTDFDTLVVQYHPEVVYKAAINWWWQYATSAGEKHSMSMGQATQNVGEIWNRAMTTIEKLEAHYKLIQLLGIDIIIGNFSRFSKQTLTRIGGVEEEAENV